MNKPLHNEKSRHISLSAATTIRLLPQAYPFVLLDRVRACYPEDGSSYSIKNITMTDPVLSGHFPGYPIYPGVLVIEAMIQNACVIPTTRDLLKHFGSYEALLELFSKPHNAIPDVANKYFLAESKVKHIEPIYPGDTLELEAKIILERDGMIVFKTGCTVEGREVARGQLSMARALAEAMPAVADKIG
jgi:3-hydroxyacyl-[acyl-carrier-protein] dehydratase